MPLASILTIWVLFCARLWVNFGVFGPFLSRALGFNFEHLGDLKSNFGSFGPFLGTALGLNFDVFGSFFWKGLSHNLSVIVLFLW